MLFVLLLAMTFSCNNDDNSSKVLDNTSWYLIGYEDSEGHFTALDYPDNCEDNSCFTLRFSEGSAFGTLDNFNPDVKDIWFGTYVAHSNNYFEYIEQPNIETLLNSGRYSKNGEEYMDKMYLVNRYAINNDTLNLHAYDFFTLIFSKK